MWKSPPSPKTVELLEEAFENALRGDGEALKVFVTLLETRYKKVIQGGMKTHRKGTSTDTVEDVFQDSLVWLIEQMKAGPDGDIPEEARRNIVQYFQTSCDRRIENARKPRLDPVLERHKSAVPFDITEDKRVGRSSAQPGEEAWDVQLSRHQALLQAEMDRLSPENRRLLELYLSKMPYSDIAKETGQPVSTLESQVIRLKQRLAERIFFQSQTAQIHQSRPKPEKKASHDETARQPSRDEIHTALGNLPIDIKRAIEFVHLRGGTVEDLAKSLGSDGLDKAKARLERGYESLGLELDAPFPESFSLLGP